MAHDQFDRREVWDEDRWEQFLQQQDRATEEYCDFAQKYLGQDRSAVFDEVLERVSKQEISSAQQGGECSEAYFEEFAKSPIYQDTLKLHTWINSWLDREQRLTTHPEAVRLATRSAVCGAKLAAALGADDHAPVGMTIAYLKRGLKAVDDALDAAAKLAQEGTLTRRRRTTLNKLLFKVRDRIDDLIHKYRTEWRKRYGGLDL